MLVFDLVVILKCMSGFDSIKSYHLTTELLFQIQLYEDFAKSQAKKSVSNAIDSEQKEDPSDSSQKQDVGSSQPSMKTMHIFQVRGIACVSIGFN